MPINDKGDCCDEPRRCGTVRLFAQVAVRPALAAPPNASRAAPRACAGSGSRRFREAGITPQESLAHKAGVHRTYVGRLERGESGVTVEALAAILPLILSLTHRRHLRGTPKQEWHVSVRRHTIGLEEAV